MTYSTTPVGDTAIRTHPDQVPGAAKLFCTFLVDGMLFGVGVNEVQEVIRFQEMTPIPLAPPFIRGLINLRGQIVTAVDVRRRLGLADRPDGGEPMNVVIHAEDGPVSLLVDEIGDVIDVSDSDFEAAPETLHGLGRLLISGVYKLDGQLLRVLDSKTTIGVEDE